MNADLKIRIPDNILFPVYSGLHLDAPADYSFPNWHAFMLPNDWKRFIQPRLRDTWQLLSPHEQYNLAQQASWFAAHFVFESVETSK